MDPAKWDETVKQLKVASPDELTSIIVESMQGKTGKQKKEIAEDVASTVNGGLQPPDAETRATLWKIVVGAFAFVLVGGFIALAIAVFFPAEEATRLAKPELILTTFTTVVGFLAGLFTPSPVAGASNGGAS